MGGDVRRRWKLPEERTDAQFPSWFEVKMNSVRKVQFTPLCPWGSRRKGGKGVLRSHGVRGQKCRQLSCTLRRAHWQIGWGLSVTAFPAYHTTPIPYFQPEQVAICSRREKFRVLLEGAWLFPLANLHYVHFHVLASYTCERLKLGLDPIIRARTSRWR